MKKPSKKTTNSLKTTKSRSFRVRIRIDGGTTDSRKSWRAFMYPKRPTAWDATDVLAVVQKMASMALTVRRKKQTNDHTTVWFKGRDGGTEITVSPDFGVWATLPGRYSEFLAPTAIAGLMSVAQHFTDAHMDLPPLVRLNRQAAIRELRRSLATTARYKASIEARIADLTGDDREGA